MLKAPGFLGRNNEDTRFSAIKPATPQAAPNPCLNAATPVKHATSASPASSASIAGATSPTSACSASAGDSTIGNRLIVGPDVKLRGAEINDCDTLIVEGRVEATLDSRIIRIAEQGSFSGTVSIDTAEVHGRFDGELTARGQLFIHASGHVSGKVRYGKILIEEGGQISGDVQAIAANDSSVNLPPKPKVALT